MASIMRLMDILCFSLLLSACSNTPTTATKVSSASAENNAAASTIPIQKNYTPLAFNMLEGEDEAGKYWSSSATVRFNWDDSGHVQLANSQPDALSPADNDKSGKRCASLGGISNMTTMWFPYTGVFVANGRLESITSHGQPLTLRSLTHRSDGAMSYIGGTDFRGEKEMYYMPCVGFTAVKTGYRLDSYIPDDAVLNVTTKTGNTLKIALPKLFKPWVLLRYQEGQVVPITTRIVVVGIDVKKHILDVEYQTTFANQPAIRQVDYRLIREGVFPSSAQGEEAMRQQEIILSALKQCPIPTRQIEPCATPMRHINDSLFNNLQTN